MGSFNFVQCCLHIKCINNITTKNDLSERILDNKSGSLQNYDINIIKKIVQNGWVFSASAANGQVMTAMAEGRFEMMVLFKEHKHRNLIA